MNEKQLEKLETRIEDVRETLQTINITLVRQELNLREHMRRTEIAEESIKHLRSEIKDTRSDLHSEIEPIQKHVDGVNYIFRVAVAISVLSGAAFSAVKLYEWTQAKEKPSAAQVSEMRIRE